MIHCDPLGGKTSFRWIITTRHLATWNRRRDYHDRLIAMLKICWFLLCYFFLKPTVSVVSWCILCKKQFDLDQRKSICDATSVDLDNELFQLIANKCLRLRILSLLFKCLIFHVQICYDNSNIAKVSRVSGSYAWLPHFGFECHGMFVKESRPPILS